MKAPTIDFHMKMSRFCKYETFPQAKHSPNNKKLHLSYFVVKVSFHSLPWTLKITDLFHLRKFDVTPPSYSDVKFGEHNQTHHQHKFNYPVGEMHWDEIGFLPPTPAHTFIRATYSISFPVRQHILIQPNCPNPSKYFCRQLIQFALWRYCGAAKVPIANPKMGKNLNGSRPIYTVFSAAHATQWRRYQCLLPRYLYELNRPPPPKTAVDFLVLPPPTPMPDYGRIGILLL